ncbi:hypothetical protein JTE90_005512 [Oedothorax gibbosus]|uniref:Ubiquitin-like protease family profile domain-containing protein n=1 Tax=Oedothorax gibbosus TaxID=931172 RepID=A0AAV6UTS6_9ARAC|nr:hypothetical protein JTE90_005512 [Oedothorax gibbosus]
MSADQLETFPIETYRLHTWWSLIANTFRYEGENTEIGHWVAFCKIDSVIYFFDPLGGTDEELLPHRTAEIQNLLQKFEQNGIEVRFVVRDGTLQSPGSGYCGEYCIYFIREICLAVYKEREENVCELLYQFLRSMDFHRRDKFVCEYVENICPVAARVCKE